MLACSFILLFRGYKRFFRRALLETSDFLKDDCLKINCTVGVVVSAIDCSRLHSIQVPESDIGAHFGMLLENMEGSDVVFDVAGEKFHAHKLVLAARSPVFRNEFSDRLEEETQEIVITDLEPKVFKVKTSLTNVSFSWVPYVCLFSGIVHEYLWRKEDSATILSLGFHVTILLCSTGYATLYL